LKDAGSATADRVCEGCTAGESFSTNDSSDTCDTVRTPCPAGQYTYADATPSTDLVCKPCGSGEFSSAEGQSACSAWKQCAAGYGKSKEGTSTADRECTKCELGKTFSDVDGADACADVSAPCKAGTYVLSDATVESDLVCDDCSSGRFTDVAGEHSCAAWKQCDFGFGLSVAGSSAADIQCAACQVLSRTLPPTAATRACLCVRLAARARRSPRTPRTVRT
jgi:hypothetical protein